jgi:hypothetical protein
MLENIFAVELFWDYNDRELIEKKLKHCSVILKDKMIDTCP